MAIIKQFQVFSGRNCEVYGRLSRNLETIAKQTHKLIGLFVRGLCELNNYVNALFSRSSGLDLWGRLGGIVWVIAFFLLRISTRTDAKMRGLVVLALPAEKL
ncbi:unnamed protein product, partial [Tenebrio molitor]